MIFNNLVDISTLIAKKKEEKINEEKKLSFINHYHAILLLVFKEAGLFEVDYYYYNNYYLLKRMCGHKIIKILLYIYLNIFNNFYFISFYFYVFINIGIIRSIKGWTTSNFI